MDKTLSDPHRVWGDLLGVCFETCKSSWNAESFEWHETSWGTLLRVNIVGGTFYIATSLHTGDPRFPFIEDCNETEWKKECIPHLIHSARMLHKDELDRDDIELAEMIIAELEEGK
jgi:hypothetical protein